MLLRKSLPRTTSVTFRAYCVRNIAACPAELPPPITWTGQFLHIRASTAVAL